jgi:hypothetical protein
LAVGRRCTIFAMDKRRPQRLSVGTKRALGQVLSGVALCYLAVVANAYWQYTSPGALIPDIRELERSIYDSHPPSRLQRLLEAEGERIDQGGTMRPAFTTDSVGWSETIKSLGAAQTARLLEEREAERQALLDWVCAGGSRQAYEQDDYLLDTGGVIEKITEKYRLSQSPPKIRIRTLISDRCVTCHSENGRHGTARFIPLDTYDNLLPRLKAEALGQNRLWVAAAVLGLFPLGLVFSVGCWNTTAAAWARWTLPLLVVATLGLACFCWIYGYPGTWHGPTLLGSAGVAACAIAIQCLVMLHDLLN